MCANRGSGVPRSGKSWQMQKIMDQFIHNPVVEVKAAPAKEKPWYRCRDCGFVQSSDSPHDDDCHNCHGINVEYLGMRDIK